MPEQYIILIYFLKRYEIIDNRKKTSHEVQLTVGKGFHFHNYIILLQCEMNSFFLARLYIQWDCYQTIKFCSGYFIPALEFLLAGHVITI